jgi:flavorubredoxin
MKTIGIDVIQDEITCQYKPDSAELSRCVEAGRQIAAKVKTMVS